MGVLSFYNNVFYMQVIHTVGTFRLKAIFRNSSDEVLTIFTESTESVDGSHGI